MNSSQAIFQKWIPLDNLGIAYDVDEIRWGDEGIAFTLISDGRQKGQGHLPKFQLIWDASHLISYHVTDESYRADCWGLDFENDGRFYVSHESEYIERFRQKSPLFPDAVIHFVIVGTNTVVDVLAKAYPKTRIPASST